MHIQSGAIIMLSAEAECTTNFDSALLRFSSIPDSALPWKINRPDPQCRRRFYILLLGDHSITTPAASPPPHHHHKHGSAAASLEKVFLSHLKFYFHLGQIKDLFLNVAHEEIQSNCHVLRRRGRGRRGEVENSSVVEDGVAETETGGCY